MPDKEKPMRRNFVVKNDHNKGGRHKSKKDYARKDKRNGKLGE